MQEETRCYEIHLSTNLYLSDCDTGKYHNLYPSPLVSPTATKDKATVTKYLALAYRFEQMREWCWLNNIDVRNVRYIFDSRDYKGYIYDLILFDGYGGRHDPGLVELVIKKAERLHWYSDGPIARAGEIVGWRDKFQLGKHISEKENRDE